MKKFLLILSLFISSFLLSNKVYADTLSLSEYTDSIDNQITFLDSHQLLIDNLVEIWETNFSMQYPFYFINYIAFSNDDILVFLVFDSSPNLVYDYEEFYSTVHQQIEDTYYLRPSSYVSNSPSFYNNHVIAYYSSNDIYCYKNHLDNCSLYGYSSSFGQFLYFGYRPASSSTNDIYRLPLINHGFKYSELTFDNDINNFNTLQFSGFTSSLYNFSYSSFDVEYNNVMPSVESLYNETYSPDELDTYTEIDLNLYDYVILSLKNYTPINEEYSTNIYTLGSLCVTPVYNYGMREKYTYYNGYQVQSCSEYYTSFTPVRFYILPSDVENHSVYYIKSSNINVSNSIKVDNDIFSITYVDSSNSSNPSVTIEGRSYPVIPYNDLTDTAIISTNEGYISGRVCAIGDVNCQAEVMGMDISDLFTSPLTLLKTLWSSITSIFTIITAFITVLPPTLQVFLYTSFMLGVILGIIKIIL